MLKTVLLFIAMLVCCISFAQIVTPGDGDTEKSIAGPIVQTETPSDTAKTGQQSLKWSFKKNVVYAGDLRLSDAQIASGLSEGMYLKYKKGRSLERWGTYFLIAGVGLTVTHLVTYGMFNDDISYAMAGTGCAAALIGVSLYLPGLSKVKKVVSNHNQSVPSVSLCPSFLPDVAFSGNNSLPALKSVPGMTVRIEF